MVSLTVKYPFFFTPSLYELKTSVLIVRKHILHSGEIYTATKNFTLPPAVTAVTNLTSECHYHYRNDRHNQKDYDEQYRKGS